MGWLKGMGGVPENFQWNEDEIMATSFQKMCEWHQLTLQSYLITLQLFHPPPSPGSTPGSRFFTVMSKFHLNSWLIPVHFQFLYLPFVVITPKWFSFTPNKGKIWSLFRSWDSRQSTQWACRHSTISTVVVLNWVWKCVCMWLDCASKVLNSMS